MKYVSFIMIFLTLEVEVHASSNQQESNPLISLISTKEIDEENVQSQIERCRKDLASLKLDLSIATMNAIPLVENLEAAEEIKKKASSFKLLCTKASSVHSLVSKKSSYNEHEKPTSEEAEIQSLFENIRRVRQEYGLPVDEEMENWPCFILDSGQNNPKNSLQKVVSFKMPRASSSREEDTSEEIEILVGTFFEGLKIQDVNNSAKSEQ